MACIFRGDGILHGGVKVLQRLKVFHFGVFDTVSIETGARFAEFLETARQLAIRISKVLKCRFGNHVLGLNYLRQLTMPCTT